MKSDLSAIEHYMHLPLKIRIIHVLEVALLYSMIKLL